MQSEPFDLKSMIEIDYRMIFEVQEILVQSLWRLENDVKFGSIR